MLWLYVLTHVSRHGSPTCVFGPLARTLAGFSYTLYLVHFPALLLLRAIWGNPTADWQPDGLPRAPALWRRTHRLDAWVCVWGRLIHGRQEPISFVGGSCNGSATGPQI